IPTRPLSGGCGTRDGRRDGHDDASRAFPGTGGEHVRDTVAVARASGGMADALVSGTSARKGVGGQVPPRAHSMNVDVPAPRPKPKWDRTRRVTAWAGLLEVPVMIAVLLLVGQQFAGSGPSDAAVTTLRVGTMAPGVLAGLISGGRFLDLYSGYAERIA